MLFFKKIVDLSTWMIIFLFFLLGAMLLVCNHTSPGDYLYPFKQNFGNFILGFR